jgi:hypothetical protein
MMVAQRHRALRDAGVKKSPQVWINLASKGKVYVSDELTNHLLEQLH